ncbi:MAG: ATP-binding protein, partial [Nitrospinaceae bacterium]
QVFQNLVGNALKFTKPETVPNIRIRHQTTGNGKVQISVEDNGIGFNQEFCDRIFKPFERLHGRTQFEGSGMGLALCKKIVERHGGGISAAGRPGEGSTIVIHLPVQQKMSV